VKLRRKICAITTNVWLVAIGGQFLPQYLCLSQRDTVVAICLWILPWMYITIVSIATKWIIGATKFGCRIIVAIVQHPCILLQYTTYIATKHELITTKLNRGNMWGLLPQKWNWWQYFILLQRNVVVAIKIVANRTFSLASTPATSKLFSIV
jgi:hypothetical protein